MGLIQDIKDRVFFFKNPNLRRWRKYDFQIDQYRRYTQKWLQDLEITTVLDIGANVGQAAMILTHAFPKATIYSYEPLPDCFDQLSDLTKYIPNLKVFNLAIGAKEGEAEFERNQYTVSSSMLKIASTHVENFPQTANTSTTKVPVARLDSVVKNIQSIGNLLIKIDVQGYEMQVMEGGRETLRKAKVVLTETSLETLYEGQGLFTDVLTEMQKLGFRYAGSFDQLYGSLDGRVLQQDSIFVKI